MLTSKTKDKCLARLPRPLHFSNLLLESAMRILLAATLHSRRRSL